MPKSKLRAIQDFANALRSKGRSLLRCGAPPQPARLMARAEFHRHVGTENILASVEVALARAAEVRRQITYFSRATLEHSCRPPRLDRTPAASNTDADTARHSDIRVRLAKRVPVARLASNGELFADDPVPGCIEAALPTAEVGDRLGAPKLLSGGGRGGYVELIVQPADGVKSLLDTLAAAQKSIDIMIFRFDLKPVEKALEAAATRGVAVRALIARESSQGDKRLRQLEMRMLEKGIFVARTGDTFVRYHGKMMIVDREELHVYGFNYTLFDLKSRSFGIVTKDRKAVTEAVRLFEADTLRQDYEPPDEDGAFVVSPETAREALATFIKRARKQLFIYDPKVTDPQMIRLISQRIKAGVDVRILGKVGKRASGLRVQKLPGIRLHVRAMIRDGDAAFVGSQSLRALELDGRREVGLIVKESKTVKRMLEVFESDWAKTDLGEKEAKEAKKEVKEQKKLAAHSEVAEVAAR